MVGVLQLASRVARRIRQLFVLFADGLDKISVIAIHGLAFAEARLFHETLRGRGENHDPGCGAG